MPASGGSVSDAPVNKVVNGQSHYLAYITPDEGKSLTDQGGKETITNSGIPAYPPPGEKGGPGSGSEGRAESRTGGEGEGGTITAPVVTYRTPDPQPSSRQPGLETSTSVAKQEAQQQDIRDLQERMAGGEGATAQDYINIHADPSISLDVKENVSDNLATKILNKTMSFDDVKSMLMKAPGLMKNSKLMSAITTAYGAAIVFAGGLGQKAQQKAINWELNRRLQKEFKIEDDPRYRTGKSDIIQERIRRANLDPDDPEHYGQNEYMDDYPGPAQAPDRDGDNARGLTNIITPYAAHAIGGTTQQPSMAANWYANLGSGNTNPGAFNLTQQYAAAKASVSQRLKSTSSIGQIAVSDSAFFNFLKDNSLNKGIL